MFGTELELPDCPMTLSLLLLLLLLLLQLLLLRLLLLLWRLCLTSPGNSGSHITAAAPRPSSPGCPQLPVTANTHADMRVRKPMPRAVVFGCIRHMRPGGGIARQGLTSGCSVASLRLACPGSDLRVRRLLPAVTPTMPSSWKRA